MSSLNKVQLIGRLGADPELKYTQNQVPVCNFTLATSEKRKDVQGNLQEQTEWHRIVCWNKIAESSSIYLKKGSQCYVEGKLVTRSWEDNQGVKRYTTEIMASTVTFLDSKGDNQNQQPMQTAQPKAQNQPIDMENIPF